MQEFKHFSVMANEAVDSLNCEPGKIYVDATLGGGGYSELILQKIQPHGFLYAFDIDDDAINASKKRLSKYKNFEIIKSSYVNIKQELLARNINKITGGVVFDLGASSHQLTCQERGFSFMKDAPLDMRFDKDSDFTAFDVVNSYSEEKLIYIFQNYGEERFTKTIARAIVKERAKNSIKTTLQLANLIKNCTPKVKSKIHPATRVFQAIRIEVNHELENVKNTLNEVIPFLDVSAIISVVSFHSLEDRIVKQTFKRYGAKCTCPPSQPICTCEGAILEVITKKPILPTQQEVDINPASRSAKLRVSKRI